MDFNLTRENIDMYKERNFTCFSLHIEKNEKKFKHFLNGEPKLVKADQDHDQIQDVRKDAITKVLLNDDRIWEHAC